MDPQEWSDFLFFSERPECEGITFKANSCVPLRRRQRETEPLTPSPRTLISTIPPSLVAFRHPSSSIFAISCVISVVGGVASSSPSALVALVEMLSRENMPDTELVFESSPIHSLTCVPKSFSTMAGLGEESSEIEGVKGIKGAEEAVEGTADGSVRIERAGRALVRARFEVGGFKEGVVFRDSERRIGAVRVGGRNDGEPPLTDMCACYLVAYSEGHSIAVLYNPKTVVSRRTRER